jgi:hypothetical protein
MTRKTTKRSKRTPRPAAPEPLLTPRVYDNDEKHPNALAWGIAKQALGNPFLLRELMLRLEDLCIMDERACPRTQLGAPIFAHLQKDAQGRKEAASAYARCCITTRTTPAEFDQAREVLRRIVLQPENAPPRVETA